MASVALTAIGCVRSHDHMNSADGSSRDGDASGRRQPESGAVGAEPRDGSSRSCDATVGLYAYSDATNACEAVKKAGCADESNLFSTFEACAAEHLPDVARYCEQDSRRPADCSCERSAQCEFECLADIDTSVEGEELEASCRAVKVGTCSKIPTPSGCYCVVGYGADADGSVGRSSVVCWEGVH